MNSKIESDIIHKIDKARELIDKYNNTRDYNIAKLKEITDKVEIAYNDVKINRIRSYAALITMKDLENDLDELLQAVTESRI